jgi:hypothetical protein
VVPAVRCGAVLAREVSVVNETSGMLCEITT